MVLGRLTGLCIFLALGACATTREAVPGLTVSTLPKVGMVDERYQSYNVEMVEITGGRFWAPFGGPPGERYRMRAPVDLSQSRLRHLARHLGPSYIRVSGTWANSTYLPKAGEIVSSPPEGFNQLLTRAQWRGVVDFAKAVDARIVTSFPASAGTRDSTGRWTPDQAQRLLDLTHEAGGSIYGAELFNEPTMPQFGAFPKDYAARDFGRDYAVFVAWARKAAPDMKLTGTGGTAEGGMLKHGSGNGGIGTVSSEDLMPATGGMLDIVSYHHYGTVSLRCGAMAFGTADKALTPEFLAMTAIDYDYYARLRDQYAPGKPIWLNETAQAACGGSPWAASFRDTFRYLNQLGILAQKGVQMVAHNTLDASDYGLIDQDNLEPRPNYWAAVLWKRTMGRVVLASPPSPSSDVRLYAHCLPTGKGGVGVLAINLGAAPHSIPASKRAAVWKMTGEPLDTRKISINGQTPSLDTDGRLRGMDGDQVAGALTLPGQSIAFIASPDAGNINCKS